MVCGLWLGFDSPAFDLLIALGAVESVFFKNYAQYAVFKWSASRLPLWVTEGQVRVQD